MTANSSDREIVRSCICSMVKGRQRPHRIVMIDEPRFGYTVIECPCCDRRRFTVRLTKRERELIHA
jgi:hypothetical protein